MEIRNLKTFILVAELRSFSQAAQRLGYSQSTVSFQIKQLEKELGVHLFERIHHDVLLTEEGRKVLHYAHRVDLLRQDLDAALSEKERITGRITLTMASSLEPLFFGKLRCYYRLVLGIAEPELLTFQLMECPDAYGVDTRHAVDYQLPSELELWHQRRYRQQWFGNLQQRPLQLCHFG